MYLYRNSLPRTTLRVGPPLGLFQLPKRGLRQLILERRSWECIASGKRLECWMHIIMLSYSMDFLLNMKRLRIPCLI